MLQRPVTSQIVIDEFTKIVDSQDDKGIEKYGETIDDAKVNKDGEPWNWELMALEESVDLNKYLIKRIQELKNAIGAIRVNSRFCKYLALEQENLVLAKENKSLKEQLELKTQAYEALLKAK